MFRIFSKAADPIPPLGSAQDFDALFDREVLVLYKHSPTCAVSRMAHREVARLQTARPEAPIRLISVRNERALSRYVAERTGVKHESPQVILMRNGQVVAVTSQWEIDGEALV